MPSEPAPSGGIRAGVSQATRVKDVPAFNYRITGHQTLFLPVCQPVVRAVVVPITAAELKSYDVLSAARALP